jgi:hypothetical protein
MKFMPVVLFVNVLMLTNISFAKFESESELFGAFNSIGLNTIVEISDLNSAQNLRVHKTEESTTMSVDQFGEAVHITALDYKEKGILTDTEYKAYSIAEIVLCYASNHSVSSRSLVTTKHRFEKCFMLPNKIKDVVNKIESL